MSDVKGDASAYSPAAPNPRKRKFIEEDCEDAIEDQLSGTGNFHSLRPTWLSTTRNPPNLYDHLAHIRLEPQALDEFNRRNALLPQLTPFAPESSSETLLASLPLRRGEVPAELQQFARLGGPDLTDLRGYTRPVSIPSLNTESLDMSQQKRKSDAQENENPDKKKSKKSNAYDDNFETFLLDRNVNGEIMELEPSNFADLKETLAEERLDMSPTNFTNDKLKKLISDIKNDTRNEGGVEDKIVTVIRGDADYPTAKGQACTAWIPLTEDVQLARAEPDYYDGLKPHKDNALLRKHLSHLIVPAPNMNPFLANFFFEVKGPKGILEGARRQAMYDGAYGARGMYFTGVIAEEKELTKKAVTFSAIYASGVLKLFAHFILRPNEKDNVLHYHMTLLDSFLLDNSLEQAREAITSFRNLRDHAAPARADLAERASKSLRKLAKAGQLESPWEPTNAQQRMDNGISPPVSPEPQPQRDTSEDELLGE